MTASDTDALVPGTTLGRYEIRRQLGRGGMGAVYEAVHRDLQKRVAVKVLAPELAANAEAKQRFLREGEAASRIRHPHVVDVTDVGTDGELTYLVMEFLEGEDLARRLTRGRLTTREAADIMLPVLAGVDAAHDVGVIHRDLKPENIFLPVGRYRPGVQAKVLDFGVSKLTDGASGMALTATAATLGTAHYIPPEQLREARQADQRSDQYSLGVVLYECVTGFRPFEAHNIFAVLRSIADGEYPPPRSVRADLRPAFEAIIVRAMQLEPAARFPSLRALGAALLPFASDTARVLWAETFTSTGPAPTPPQVDLSQVAPPPPAGPSAPRLSTLGTATGQRFETLQPAVTRGRLIAGAVAIGAVGGVVAFILLWRQTTQTVTSGPAPAEVAAAPAAVQRFHVDVTTAPASATLELDGVAVGAGALRVDLARDGKHHRLVARAPGFREAVVHFADQAPPARITLESVPAAPPAPARPAAATPARPHRHLLIRTASPPARAPARKGGPAPQAPLRTSNGAPVIE